MDQVRMTGAELAARRTNLGLTMVALAERLNVRKDTIAHWEMGKNPVPYRVLDELNELAKQQKLLAAQMATSGSVVQVRRKDSWGIAAAGRALEIEPDLMVEWLDE